ncbi:V-SNARE coiled-coil homology domain-containing protein [Caenorhabditis elegans]|nr:V-SNARE coiled-coil homology domain-containing protein [Caenorhabditis elegans]CAA98946.3 V-SNARE coiled-coil homology domain-containing protein [Caenorhabditis elegans]|eukprot:NP_506093.2 SyNaptoBrevin related [Caenorhabditis elegans]
MSANNEANKDLEAGNGEAQPPTGTYNTKRMQMAQAQVNEVIDVMRNNVNKVMERDVQLNSLDHRAEVLQNGASQFQQSSRTLRQKYWWQNIRMMIIIGLIAFLVIGIFLIWIFN